MTNPVWLLTAMLLAAPGLAHPQDPVPLRAERLVQQSPHFDELAPPHVPSDCPAGPMHLLGVEQQGALQPPNAALLHVLVRKLPRAPGSEPIEAEVHLERLTDLTGQPVDGGGISATTRPDGTMDFGGIAGYYQITINAPGFRGGTGQLKMKASATDSLHVYLDPVAACPGGGPK
jgi:hypothetical protein